MVEKGVVLELGTSADWDNDKTGFPSVVDINGQLATIYEATNPTTLSNEFAIGLRFIKGLSSIKKGLVIPNSTDSFNQGGVRTPCIIEKDGYFYNLFCAIPGGYLSATAISRDLINWIQKSIVIPKGNSVDSDSWGNIAASVIKKDGRYFCYISTSGDTNRVRFRVNLYITKDFINFVHKGVVMPIGQLGEIDSVWAAHPSVTFENGLFTLYYVVNEHRATTRRIAVAVSKDGINFVKKGVSDDGIDSPSWDAKQQNFLVNTDLNKKLFQLKMAKDFGDNTFRTGVRISEALTGPKLVERPLESDDSSVLLIDGRNTRYPKYAFNDNFIEGSGDKGLRFDGIDDYVDLSDPTDGSLDFDFRNDSMTLVMKINCYGDNSAVSVQNLLIKKSSGTSVPGYSSWVLKNSLGGYVRFRLLTANEYSTHGVNTKILGTGWHSVAFTYDASSDQINAYTDGQLDNYLGSPGSFTPTATSENSDSAVIGSKSTGDGGFFNGVIEYMAVFKRALSATEISDIHNGNVDIRSLSDLVLYQNFAIHPIGPYDYSAQGSGWGGSPNDGNLKPGFGSVTDETFTSDFDTPVQLAHTNIENLSEVVTTIDGLTTFTKGTDYTIDYKDGTITVLSTGSMADATDYYIDYNYRDSYPRYIGFPNHGIPYNAPSLTADGFRFDYTVPEYMRIPYISSADPLKGNSPFTIAVGLKFHTLPSAISNYMTILSQDGGNGTGRAWLMAHQDDTIHEHIGNLTFTGTIAVDTWYLYVLRYDGTTLETFTNNVAGPTKVTTVDLAADGEYFIGIDRSGARYPADITIDYMGWFKRKLTDSEMTELYDWWRSRH